jgi:hypothetical protein
MDMNTYKLIVELLERLGKDFSDKANNETFAEELFHAMSILSDLKKYY